MDWSNKTPEELKARDAWIVMRSQSELTKGFDLMADVGPCVSIFGSSRIKHNHYYYQIAENVSTKLAEKGFGIITGGGPGIMEAANKGAKENNGKSIGLGIDLPFEASNNEYIDNDKNMQLHYFYVRKVMFLKYSQGFVFMPGGLGTLDELFEVLTLGQTEKTPKFPVFLVGNSFWGGLIDWMKNTLIELGTISETDFDLFRIVETSDEIIDALDEFHDKYRQQYTTNF